MYSYWAPSSEFVSSSIPSWQILTAHAQPFRGARDLVFCLKVPLDSLLVWASSEGSGETARIRRLAWTFAARIGDKYTKFAWRGPFVCERLPLLLTNEQIRKTLITLGDGTTEKVFMILSGYSSRILLIIKVPIPDPVPPPREWVSWNPWRQSQLSDSFLTTSRTESTSSAPSV